MHRPQRHASPSRQHGVAMMVMLVIMVMGFAAVLVGSLSSTALKIEQQKKTADALAQAKDALIGYAITYGDSHASNMHGYLPCPDTDNNGTSNTNQSSTQCAVKNIPVVGRLPWKSLGLPPLRDGNGECLWYAVSGTFKAVAGGYMNELMNWDNLGQFMIQDTNGATLAGATAHDRPVAVIFSAGSPLNTQSHPLGSGQECSGDASNLVTVYLEGGNAFTPPTLPPASPIALTVGDRSSSVNNDIALWITPSDIFDRIKKRGDFSTQITHLLDDSDFRLKVETGHSETVAISGTKGTDSVNCDTISDTANRVFCNNWKEMLLLTELSPPSPITIDGTPTASCSRTLIFGGQRNSNQYRQTDTEKANPNNYLEEPNLSAFSTPTAASANFSGASFFDANNPSADLLRCLP